MFKSKNYYFLCTPMYSWDGTRLCWDKDLQNQWKFIIQKLERSGIGIIAAFRDLPQDRKGSWLRKKEFELIKRSKGVIVILGNTPGIYAESGYAVGVKKKIYGIRTERFYGFGKKVQDWIESLYTKVFDTPEEFINFLSKRNHQKRRKITFK